MDRRAVGNGALTHRATPTPCRTISCLHTRTHQQHQGQEGRVLLQGGGGQVRTELGVQAGGQLGPGRGRGRVGGGGTCRSGSRLGGRLGGSSALGQSTRLVLDISAAWWTRACARPPRRVPMPAREHPHSSLWWNRVRMECWRSAGGAGRPKLGARPALVGGCGSQETMSNDEGRKYRIKYDKYRYANWRR